MQLKHKQTIHSRTVQLDDAPTLASIEALVQPCGWTCTDFTQTLQQHANGCVIIHQQQLIGFCLWQQVLDEASLLNIAVHPQYQRQGLGRQLVQMMIDNSQAHHAIHLFLEVRRSNQAAIALYEQLGFVEMGIRRQYYRTPQGREDALLMGYTR